MNQPKVVIDSRWGALGSLLVLQSYGFMMVYFFSEAISQLTSIPTLSEIPDTILAVLGGLVFFSAFLYAQTNVLKEIIKYLNKARDPGGWFDDMASVQGMIRVILTLAAAVLYLDLLFGKYRFGLPKINFFILAGYQIFHPIAGQLVARRLRKKEFKTRTVYRSAGSQLAGFFICLVGAGIFGGTGFALQQDHEPMCWVFQTLGVGLGTMTLVGFLLADIKGRTIEQLVDAHGRS